MPTTTNLQAMVCYTEAGNYISSHMETTSGPPAISCYDMPPTCNIPHSPTSLPLEHCLTFLEPPLFKDFYAFLGRLLYLCNVFVFKHFSTLLGPPLCICRSPNLYTFMPFVSMVISPHHVIAFDTQFFLQLPKKSD